MKKFSFSKLTTSEVAEVAEVIGITQKKRAEVVLKFSEVSHKKENRQTTSDHFRFTSKTANSGIATTSATSASSEGLDVKNVIHDTIKCFDKLSEVEKSDIVTELIPNLKPCIICNGLDFIHGHHGGYYCKVCQPAVRLGVLVRAGTKRRRKGGND